MGTITCDDLMLRLWPMPPSRFLCVASTVHPPQFVAMAKWTRLWNCVVNGSNFQKAYVEEWEQEVHTSDDQLQERECHREDSNTWSRRAHELSELEMFACLTCTDCWNESDSPCEPESATKPMNNGWSVPNDLPTTPPGQPSTPQASWQPYSDTNTRQKSWVFRRHVVGLSDEPAAVKPVVPEIVHRIQYGIAPIVSSCLTRTRRSSRTLMRTSPPYETVIQPGWCLMQPQRGNTIWRAKVVQYLNSARPTREGILLPSQNTVWTPACQTVCSSRHASAF